MGSAFNDQHIFLPDRPNYASNRAASPGVIATTAPCSGRSKSVAFMGDPARFGIDDHLRCPRRSEFARSAAAGPPMGRSTGSGTMRRAPRRGDDAGTGAERNNGKMPFGIHRCHRPCTVTNATWAGPPLRKETQVFANSVSVRSDDAPGNRARRGYRSEAAAYRKGEVPREEPRVLRNFVTSPIAPDTITSKV